MLGTLKMKMVKDFEDYYYWHLEKNILGKHYCNLEILL